MRFVMRSSSAYLPWCGAPVLRRGVPMTTDPLAASWTAVGLNGKPSRV